MAAELTNITVEYDCPIRASLKDGRLVTILAAFALVLPQILTMFVETVLLAYAQVIMDAPHKPFACARCGNDQKFIWKTQHGKPTKILTVYQWVILRQLQIQCSVCRHKFYLTRPLLGMEPHERIPKEVYRKLGLVGALASYRVGAKIVSTFGWTLDKMTIWKAVQKTAKEIVFELDPHEAARGEADGTGIGIQGIAKRGQELKVFAQYKHSGGIRVAGLGLGTYHGGWKALFQPSLEAFKQFKQFLLVTDGDTSILDGLKGQVQVLVQRCLWHIPHQLKFALWQDRKHVPRKSPEWLHIMSRIFDICAIRSGIEDEAVIQALVATKRERLTALIAYCREHGCRAAATYLENAQGDLFTALTHRLEGKTQSRVERLMRTVNLRVNVGKWSTAGGLNVVKVRLAYYYNDFDA